MSPTDKPDPERGGAFLANLVADAEVERVLGLTDEELRAEMARDPSPGRSREPLLARVKARAEHEGLAEATDAQGEWNARDDARPAHTMPRHRVWLLLAAAFVAGVLVVAVLESRGEVAIVPKVPAPAPSFPPEPSPEEVAAMMRSTALEKCAQHAWVACGALLDRAAALDPAGEAASTVKKARAEIAEAAEKKPK